MEHIPIVLWYELCFFCFFCFVYFLFFKDEGRLENFSGYDNLGYSVGMNFAKLLMLSFQLHGKL